tara:strand:- start:145 stop:639 length:495 start_codon:yes stop_codon:yes gene_type:complete
MSDAFEVAWRLTKGSAAPSYHQEKNQGIENLAMNPVDDSMAMYGKNFDSGHSREAAQENVYAEQGSRGPQASPRNVSRMSNTANNPERAIPDNPAVAGVAQNTAYGNRVVERAPRPDEGQEDSFGSRGYEEGMGDSSFQPSTDFSGNIPQPQKKGGMLSRFMRR